MQMLAEFVQAAEAVDQLIGEILRMGGGEADPCDPLDGIDLTQQLGKGDFPRILLPVGVDVLTDQGDLPHPRGRKFPHFGENFAARPADLPTAHMGDDAIGAEIVAALHDGDETGDGVAFAAFGKELQPGLLIEKLRLQAALPAGLDPPHHLRQFVDVMGAENQIDEGQFLQQLFPFLLGHTTTDPDDHPRIALLDRLETAKVAVDLALGLVPHCAGVEQHQVGDLGAVDLMVADLLQQLDDALRIDHIHLAAEGFQIKFLLHIHGSGSFCGQV